MLNDVENGVGLNKHERDDAGGDCYQNDGIVNVTYPVTVVSLLNYFIQTFSHKPDFVSKCTKKIQLGSVPNCTVLLIFAVNWFLNGTDYS